MKKHFKKNTTNDDLPPLWKILGMEFSIFVLSALDNKYLGQSAEIEPIKSRMMIIFLDFAESSTLFFVKTTVI